MTTGWIILFLIVNLVHFLGTWNLYERAGRKKWEAAIPIYNAIVLMEIINRPKWWVILLFIPVVNLLMFPVIWVETCRSFRYNETSHTLLAIFTLGFYIYYINYNTKSKHIKDRDRKATTWLGDFISSIVFAIVAATLVHTYFIQPYTIPTSSLEKTLLVGDFLFVSKFHYGARTPMSAISAPMVHDTILGLKIKSYVSDSKAKSYKTSWLNKLSFPYFRLPGIQDVKRNDIVVFSWPADSTNYMWGDNSGKFTYKPIDKKTNYVKRCVGIPGDSLSVIDGYVHINGKRTTLPPNAKPQWNHAIYAKNGLSTSVLKKYVYKEFERTYKVTLTNQQQLNVVNQVGTIYEKVSDNEFLLKTNDYELPRALQTRYGINFVEIPSKKRLVNLTDEEAEMLRKEQGVDSIVKAVSPALRYDKTIFPHDPNYQWNMDNFGPIYIPKKGDKVAINTKTLPFYEQIIKRYENNDLTVFNNQIYINGKQADSYTFKKDYYWMMGDNRQRSLDARAWGYTPFDHIVGKPIMIWFSFNPNAGSITDQIKSIRWKRMFTTIPTSGAPKSYFWPAIVVIALVLFSIFKPKKKKA